MITPEKVGAYIRTSTDQQEASEQEQMEYIQDFCRKQGWEPEWIRNDEISGYEDLDRRPGLRKLVEEQLKFGFTKIVVWQSDRAFRNAEVALRVRRILRERGCYIIGVQDPIVDDGSAQATMFTTISAAGAEYYRNALRDRQKASHKFKVSKGLHQGGAAPFGYVSVKEKYQIGHVKYAGWEPDGEVFAGKSIAEWVVWIFEEFLRTQNTTAIALKLNELGVPSSAYLQRWHRLSEAERAYRVEKAQRRAATGRKVMAYPPPKEWDPSRIADGILRSRAYLGEVSYTPSQGKNYRKDVPKKQTWHPGLHQALVSHQIFNQVQIILDARAQSHRKPATKTTDVLLGGLILCGACGKAVSRLAKNKWQTKYYCNRARTTRGTVCSEVRYNTKAVDEAATRLLIRGIKLRRQQIIAGGLHQPAKTDDSLGAEMTALSAEKDQLMVLFRKGYIDELKLDAEMVPLLAKIDALKAKLAEVNAPTSVDELTRIVAHIETEWTEFSYDKQRLIIQTYVPKGFILAGGVLRATVCGLTLEAEVEKFESPEPGIRYGLKPGERKALERGSIGSEAGKELVAAGQGCYPMRQSRRSDLRPRNPKRSWDT